MIAEVTKQLDLWPATQPKNPFDVVQAAIQKDLQRQVSTAGPDPRSLLIGQIDAPEAVSALSHPNRDEFRVFDSSRATVPFHRAAIVAGALVAAVGLGWAGGWSAYRFLGLAPASTRAEHASDCRRYSDNKTVCATSKSDRETLPAAANMPKLPARTGGVGGDEEPSRRTAQGGGVSTNTGALPNQKNASSTTSAASATSAAVASRDQLKSSPRFVPAAQTRPKTIERWRVREVTGGKVILEGPNGVFEATRGDTVPGIGRVDSIVRWGNHWIVATTRGLISTTN
jgi:hypothetical protein